MNTALPKTLLSCAALLWGLVPSLAGAADAQQPATQAQEGKVLASRAVLRLDADLNDDGIIDAVASHVLDKTSTTFSPPPETLSLAPRRPLPKLSNAAKRARMQSSCVNYLLLAPAEKAKVDRRVNAVTQGTFGSRPCDPFVSSDIERPFDDDYIDVPLLPIRIIVP